MKTRFCVLVSLLTLATGLRADEIRLKDGSKIVGTIVDYENDSFKVQTAYGFATVRKDSIAQIIPTEPAKSPDSAKSGEETKSVSPTPISAPARPAITPAASPASSPTTVLPRPTNASLPMPAPHPRATVSSASS